MPLHAHGARARAARPAAGLALLSLALAPLAAAHGVEDHGGEGGTNKVLVAKTVTAALYFVLTFAAGWLVRTDTSPVLLSYANVFSAGVFFATGLLHMLYAGVIEFDDLEWTDEYPLAYVIALAAFLVTQGVDMFAQHRAEKDMQGVAPAAGKGEVELEGGVVRDNEAVPVDAHAHHGKMHKSVLGVLLVSFFSHSIVEGLAIGIQSELSSVVQLGISLFLHKAFAAVALGIALVRNVESQAGRAARLAAFAIATPIGIIIALILHENTTGNTQLALAAFLDSASAGAFLYISLFNVLLPEVLTKRALLTKYFLFLGGCACISVFMIWH